MSAVERRPAPSTRIGAVEVATNRTWRFTVAYRKLAVGGPLRPSGSDPMRTAARPDQRSHQGAGPRTWTVTTHPIWATAITTIGAPPVHSPGHRSCAQSRPAPVGCRTRKASFRVEGRGKHNYGGRRLQRARRCAVLRAARHSLPTAHTTEPAPSRVSVSAPAKLRAVREQLAGRVLE